MVSEFQVGILLKPHGLKGEAKVLVTSDDPERFGDLEKVTAVNGSSRQELFIENVRYFKNLAIIKFRGVDSVESVQKLRGAELLIPREEAMPLEDNEYYICDLIGCEVADDTGKRTGVLKDVLRTGANDVYIVETDEGSEILLPAIKECILSVDTKNSKITVHMMKGLMDI